jgi:tRNA-dihydrouridine synthase B
MQSITIGAITLPRTAALAPMAGVADRAFRELCRSFGACCTVGEMASGKGLLMSCRRTGELLEASPEERPMAVQLFGDDPEILAEAARRAMAYAPDWIDLNMGCPAPKVAGNGGGSALMKRPRLAGEIVRAVSRAVEAPVTVKFRKGWDAEQVNAVEFAKICEENGAAALTIHGRTREQMYAPPADWEIIRQVKQAVSVPVIGNGDVDSPEAALKMYRETGCDLVMVGRGALGNPWLFGQIRAYLETGEYPPPPSLEERMAVMDRHIRLLCRYKGEKVGMREARKHTAWYLKGFRGAAALRGMCGQLKSLEDLPPLIQAVLSAAREGE